MLDLYKDEAKKVFKIMDVIIDQEIDVNMKRPLHLWYYQDKTKQEERLKLIIEKHKKKKKKKKKKSKSSASTGMAQTAQHTNSSQQAGAQSQVAPTQKPMNYPPPPPASSIPSSQACLSNRRRMNGAPLQPPPQMRPSLPIPVGIPHNMPIPFMPNGSFLPPNHPRAGRPLLPHPPPHFSPSSNGGPMRLPPLFPPRYQFQMAPPFPRLPNGFPCPMPPGPGPRPPAIPLGSFVMKPTNIRALQQSVMGKHGTQRNGIITQKVNKNSKCGKTGCKRPVSIVYRNRSTEALAHSMTELAKSVLFRSGGHLASSFYVRDSETGNVKTPNHVLHMCALQLAMYGLGISNNASSAWESRSYSPHVAMLTSLAIDIGAPALMFIIENWPGHLTPGEANSLADRGSRSENPVVQNLAARLALSCLTYADKLTSHEIIQAINQCRNLGLDMQEKACCEIEKVAKTHSLQSDVLFYVSKLWHNIYSKDELEEVDEPKNVKASTSNASSRCPMPTLSHFTIYRPVSSLSGQSKSSSVLNEVKVLKKRTYYLLASYRLSMMAFHNLSGDINEEKAHYRFHCLPNYTNDVYRTMQIAKLLGDKWVHHFCMVVENTLVNPFLLYEVACSASLHFSRCNPSALHYIMSTLVKNLINKCEAMFFLYLHNKLYNMAQYEEEEFINMAQLAHKAFSVSADGPYRYQEWLQSLRSHEGTVRDLYVKITRAIEHEERSNKNTFRENETACKETVLPFHHDAAKHFGDSKLKAEEEDEDDDDDDEDDEDEDEDDDDDNDDEEDDDEDGNVDDDEEEEDDDDDNRSVQMVSDEQEPGPSSENRTKCNNSVGSGNGSNSSNKEQNTFTNRGRNTSDDIGDTSIDRKVVLGLNSNNFLS